MALPPTQFRKRPVVITAVQWDGTNTDEVVAFGEGKIEGFDADLGVLTISTLEGDLTVSLQDWVIKGVQGEFYPCKPDIFTATYEDP